MCSSDDVVRGDSQSFANCDVIGPEYRIGYCAPLHLITIGCFEQCLTYIEVRFLDDPVCSQIVPQYLYVLYVVLGLQYHISFDKGGTIIGYNFGKYSPLTEDILIDPFSEQLAVSDQSILHSG